MLKKLAGSMILVGEPVALDCCDSFLKAVRPAYVEAFMKNLLA